MMTGTEILIRVKKKLMYNCDKSNEMMKEVEGGISRLGAGEIT